MQLFERALQLDPDFALAHSDLGLAYGSFIFNDRVRSREHLERAMALRTRVTERERLVVELNYHTSLGHTDEAAVIYGLYLAKWPDDAGQRFNYANTLRDGGRIDKAIEQFRQALRIAPKYARALVNLVTCYVTQGRFNDAVASWDKAFAIEPTRITSGNLNNEYGFTPAANGDLAGARCAAASAGDPPRQSFPCARMARDGSGQTAVARVWRECRCPRLSQRRPGVSSCRALR